MGRRLNKCLNKYCRNLIFSKHTRRVFTFGGIMRAIQTLRNTNSAQLIPSFKKNERRLLSVFMASLDIVPGFRSHILKFVGYGSGRTCTYKSFMEPVFEDRGLPPGRPDGLIVCKRGASSWSALIEAKSDKNYINVEQIENYANLAKHLGIDTIISISNEFSAKSHELPYTVTKAKQKGRSIYHLSWSKIASELGLFLETHPQLLDAEKYILEETERFLTSKDSGVSTFDEMSPKWKDFVASANTVIGFNTATSGVAEIVKDWQQERRDLCIKLNQQVGGGITSLFPSKVRHDQQARKKLIREQLTSEYRMEAEYLIMPDRSLLRIVADLRACSTTFVFKFDPPKNKMAKAIGTWLAKCLRDYPDDFTVLIDWPGRDVDTTFAPSQIVNDPHIIAEGKKYAPKSIAFIRTKQDARRFKSRKGFIQDLESGAKGLINLASNMQLL